MCEVDRVNDGVPVGKGQADADFGLTAYLLCRWVEQTGGHAEFFPRLEAHLLRVQEKRCDEFPMVVIDWAERCARPLVCEYIEVLFSVKERPFVSDSSWPGWVLNLYTLCAESVGRWRSVALKASCGEVARLGSGEVACLEGGEAACLGSGEGTCLEGGEAACLGSGEGTCLGSGEGTCFGSAEGAGTSGNAVATGASADEAATGAGAEAKRWRGADDVVDEWWTRALDLLCKPVDEPLSRWGERLLAPFVASHIELERLEAELDSFRDAWLAAREQGSESEATRLRCLCDEIRYKIRMLRNKPMALFLQEQGLL